MCVVQRRQYGIGVRRSQGDAIFCYRASCAFFHSGVGFPSCRFFSAFWRLGRAKSTPRSRIWKGQKLTTRPPLWWSTREEGRLSLTSAVRHPMGEGGRERDVDFSSIRVSCVWLRTTIIVLCLCVFVLFCMNQIFCTTLNTATFVHRETWWRHVPYDASTICRKHIYHIYTTNVSISTFFLSLQ